MHRSARVLAATCCLLSACAKVPPREAPRSSVGRREVRDLVRETAAAWKLKAPEVEITAGRRRPPGRPRDVRALMVEILDERPFGARMEIEVPAVGDDEGAAAVAALERLLNWSGPATGKDDGGGEVEGFYWSQQRTLFVKDTPLDDYARLVLAHEISHALQDRAVPGFDRTRTPPGDMDAAAANEATSEGQAMLGEALYARRRRSVRGDVARDLRQYRESVAEADTAADAASPASYSYGYRWAWAVSRKGRDPGAVLAAFERPPVTTREILHPGLYRRGWRPRPVATPDIAGLFPSAVVLGDGALGEMQWGFFLLGLGIESPGEALAAVDAWEGDRYRAVRTRNGEVAAVRATWKSPADARDVVEAFEVACDLDRGEVCQTDASFVTMVSRENTTLLLAATDAGDLEVLRGAVAAQGVN